MCAAYVQRYALPFTVGFDATSAIFHTYHAFGLPTQLFLDRDGVIRNVVLGPVNRPQVEQILAPLLSEPAASSFSVIAARKRVVLGTQQSCAGSCQLVLWVIPDRPRDALRILPVVTRPDVGMQMRIRVAKDLDIDPAESRVSLLARQLHGLGEAFQARQVCESCRRAEDRRVSYAVRIVG